MSNDDAKILRPTFGGSRSQEQDRSEPAAGPVEVIRPDFSARRRSEEKTSPWNPVIEDLERGRTLSPEEEAKRFNTLLTSRHKLKAFEQMLQNGVVMVMLDPTHPGVVVPAGMDKHVSLNLNFSLKYGLRDFVYNEQSVSASLSFNKRLTHCVIPWTAVFGLKSAIDDNDHLVWPDDMPEVLRNRVLLSVRSEPESRDPKLK